MIMYDMVQCNMTVRDMMLSPFFALIVQGWQLTEERGASRRKVPKQSSRLWEISRLGGSRTHRNTVCLMRSQLFWGYEIVGGPLICLLDCFVLFFFQSFVAGV